MEQISVLALLLAAVFAFLARTPQQFLRNLLHRRPAWIFAAPPLLTAVFTIAAALSGVSSPPLTLLVLAYTVAPVLCAYAQGAGPVSRPSALDSRSCFSGCRSNSRPARASFRGPHRAFSTAWHTASPSFSAWCCSWGSAPSPV